MQIMQAVTTARHVDLEVRWIDPRPGLGVEGLVARILGMDDKKCFQRFECASYKPTDREIADEGIPPKWEHSRRDVQAYVNENGCWVGWLEAMDSAIRTGGVGGVIAELEIAAVLVDGLAMQDMVVPAGLEGGCRDGIFTVNVPPHQAQEPGRSAVVRAARVY